MKKLLTVRVNKKKIEFGEPVSDKELLEMFRFRYKIYSQKGHIYKNKKEIDIDKHDEPGNSLYVVATYKGKIIGTARLIIEKPLPIISDYYTFKEPAELENLTPGKKVEVGRIISFPPEANIKLPSHLVILGIFYTSFMLLLERGYVAGYGTVKSSVRRKLNKIGFPLHEIKDFTPKFKKGDKGDSSNNFFTDKKDIPIPIYYFASEVKSFLDRVFCNKILFKKEEGELLLRSSLLFSLYLLLQRGVSKK